MTNLGTFGGVARIHGESLVRMKALVPWVKRIGTKKGTPTQAWGGTVRTLFPILHFANVICCSCRKNRESSCWADFF